MAYKASLHAPIVSANVDALLKGQTASAEYKKPEAEMLALPIGKNGGLTYLAFFGGFTLGAWVTKQLKGKTLLVPNQKKAVLRY